MIPGEMVEKVVRKGRGFNPDEVQNLRSWGYEPRPDEIEPIAFQSPADIVMTREDLDRIIWRKQEQAYKATTEKLLAELQQRSIDLLHAKDEVVRWEQQQQQRQGIWPPLPTRIHTATALQGIHTAHTIPYYNDFFQSR